MSDADEMVAWLNAVLDKREQTAADIESVGLGNLLPAAIIGGTGATVYFTPEADARIVATLSPDAMRRAVAVKRKRLNRHQPITRFSGEVICKACSVEGYGVIVYWPCIEVRTDAEEFASEPGYDARRWAP